MAKTKKRPLTELQVLAKARKKDRLAALKKSTDKVIDRNTRTEFAKYYTPQNRLLDVIEAAKLLGVTKRRVRSFINTGRLEAVRLNKLYLIKFSDLVLFKEKPRISGAPTGPIGPHARAEFGGFFDTPPEAEKNNESKH